MCCSDAQVRISSSRAWESPPTFQERIEVFFWSIVVDCIGVDLYDPMTLTLPEICQGAGSVEDEQESHQEYMHVPDTS